MSERIASWVAVALAALVLGTSWWYSLNLGDGERGGATRSLGVDSRAESIVLTAFDDAGRPRYRLFAEQMEHNADNDDLALTHPRIISLRADQPQVEAVGDDALARNNAETVDLRGNVVLSRAAGAGRPALRLETDTLHAVPDDDRYSTEDRVRVEQGGSEIHATGMVYDNIARRLDLLAAVDGRFAHGHR